MSQPLTPEDDPTTGLPPELAKLLRDPRIILPKDAAVFEIIAEWANAPSDTPSAMTADDWQGAWSFMCKKWQAAEAEIVRLRGRVALLTEAGNGLADFLDAIYEGAVDKGSPADDVLAAWREAAAE